jgi:NAD(P)-dependent dehydrogenase (short-subunit alcohol dehydrogenase family)
MDLQLDGRVALVVGGTGYIGSAIVRALRAEGATAIAAARGDGGDLVMDARDDESVRAGIAAVLAEHGRLDAVVVTAAPSAGTLDPARASDPAQVLEAFDQKALSFLRIANAALPTLRDRGFGRIVGISGQNAYLTGSITGAVRNAGIIIASKHLADSVAGSGVTVNVVNPGGVVDEPSSDVEPGQGGQSSPEQIAALVAFLASPVSAGVSGESIAVGHRVRGVLAF